MQSEGFFVLIVEMLLFIAIAARCGWELIRTTPQWVSLLRHLRERHRTSQGGRHQQPTTTPQDSPEEGESMSGVGARRSVQTMLVPACILRAALTLFILFRTSWTPYLVLPDLAYLATHGFLVIFLAEMQQIRVGTRYVWIKFTAWALLAIVLIASLIVCTVNWGSDALSKRSLVLRRFLYYEIGVTYLVMFVAFVYFGGRVCATATHNRRIFYRVVLLTLVCGLAMASKGCTLVAAAAVNGWRTDALFPNSAERYRFEAFITLDELLPSIAIMVLTSKGRGNRSPVAPSESTNFVRFGESSNMYNTPLSSPSPSLANTPFSYGLGTNIA